MILKYIVLIYGVVEFIIGAACWITKNDLISKMFINTLSMISEDISYSNVKNNLELARWVGGIIMLGGSMYIFLASAAIYFGINTFMIIVFIILIESFIFKTIVGGVKDFL